VACGFKELITFQRPCNSLTESKALLSTATDHERRFAIVSEALHKQFQIDKDNDRGQKSQTYASAYHSIWRWCSKRQKMTTWPTEYPPMLFTIKANIYNSPIVGIFGFLAEIISLQKQ
jgi:hypothetical protein